MDQELQGIIDNIVLVVMSMVGLIDDISELFDIDGAGFRLVSPLQVVEVLGYLVLGLVVLREETEVHQELDGAVDVATVLVVGESFERGDVEESVLVDLY